MKRLVAPATLVAAVLVAASAFLGGGPYWPF